MVCCFVRVSPLRTFLRQVLPRDLAPGAEYPVASSVLSRCVEPAKDRRSGDDCKVVSPGCSLLGLHIWAPDIGTEIAVSGSENMQKYAKSILI